MLRFDERFLVSELESLSDRAQVAFATAAATRQLTSFERLARKLKLKDEHRPREIASRLWDDLTISAAADAEWSGMVDHLLEILPDGSEELWLERALADDALSALAYAIRCRLTLAPQEAAWAARRAYEAADQAAIRITGVQPGSFNAEAELNSHHFVQRELARQQMDLRLLRVGSIEDVRLQAFTNEMLTADEAVSLASKKCW
jgi:uncharacterized protein YjaG (DUF416 family)